MIFPSWQPQTDLRSFHLSLIRPPLPLTNQLPPLRYLHRTAFYRLASRYLWALCQLPRHLGIPSHRLTDFRIKRDERIRPPLTPTPGEATILTMCWPQSTTSITPCNDAIMNALDNRVHVPPLTPPSPHGVPLHQELHVPFAPIIPIWTTKAIFIPRPLSTPIRQLHPRTRLDRVQDHHNTTEKNLNPTDTHVFISVPYFLLLPKLYRYIYIYIFDFNSPHKPPYLVSL